MRYFLISYVVTGAYISKIFGDFTIASRTIPSRQIIERSIKADGRKTILNIYEFKSEQEYNDFISHE